MTLHTHTATDREGNQILPLGAPESDPVQIALRKLSEESEAAERGAVFTRIEVVEAILDLCGYTSSSTLTEMRILEPSCGEGEFLLPAIRRLVEAAKAAAPKDEPQWWEGIDECICAVELHSGTAARARDGVRELLEQEGCPADSAASLADKWVRTDDFLLWNCEHYFDVVVGNPPYVRQERVPPALLSEYRKRFSTLYDRADLYVPFIEKGLSLLAQGGSLGFICANRWTRNRYGGPLRELVTGSFWLKLYANLEGADAFHSEVLAYPAIFVIENAVPGETRVTPLAGADPPTIRSLSDSERSPRTSHRTSLPLKSEAPWLLDSPQVFDLIRQLESAYPTIEDDGVEVGIGVATGRDKFFIGKYDELPVEDERKLKLAVAKDVHGGKVSWSGLGVINPWLETGELARLEDWPRFAAHLATRKEDLLKRHTARKAPQNWYRTIDRIVPSRTVQPKLLIPDIKGTAEVGYESGELYAHHNLYTMMSDTWDVTVLQAFLRSSVAIMFIGAYSPRMAGGFLRFQAQYLRRIRVPSWSRLSSARRSDLREVAMSSRDEIDAVVMPAFGLEEADAQCIREYAESCVVGGGR